MVVTPNTRALDPGTPLSPLLLASSSSVPVPPLGSTTPTGNQGPPPFLRRRTSASSFSKLAEFWLDGTPTGSGAQTPQVEKSGISGVAHASLSIDAGEWRHPVFKQKVLGILRRLAIPRWNHPDLTSSRIHLQKVSGALTNAVFFVTYNPSPVATSPSMSPLLTPTLPATDPDHPPPLNPDQYPETLLLRIYGPSSGDLINRDEELRILHVLSSTYGLGPRVYGTFLNGRVEQFFPSRALTPDELRVPIIARGIARRMRELHSVDLRLLGYDSGREGQPVVWKEVSDWAVAAQETLSDLAALGGKWEVFVEQFALHKLHEELETYRTWVTNNPDKGKHVVFAHNDTQYGNLLLLDAKIPKGVPPHHQYIVIDFEYAAPNHRGYDIANHFHEWRANYHHPTLSYSLRPHFPYPTIEQRQDWYRAYLSVQLSSGEEAVGRRADVPQHLVDELEKEVRIWSPACSAMWALWGIIQAEEQIKGLVTDPNYEAEFDYLQYGLERLEMFRQEARELGVAI